MCIYRQLWPLIGISCAMYRVAVSDVCAAAQSAVCTSKVPLKNSVDTYTASAKRKDAARCLQGVGACGRISPARGDKLRLRTSSIKKQHPFGCCFFGACGRIRTGDLLITSELLYQLSHSSTLHICCNRQYFTIFLRCCQGRISCKRGSFCKAFHKKLLHFSPAAL